MAVKNLEVLAGGAEAFDVDGVFKAPLYYRQVVAVHNADSIDFYISGVVGFSGSPTVEGDAFEQAMQTIANIKCIVSAAAKHYGVSAENPLRYIVRTDADVFDHTNFSHVNRAYAESGMPMAARKMVPASAFPLGILVEITPIARLPKQK